MHAHLDYGDCEQEERRRSFPVESPFSLCHFCCWIISEKQHGFEVVKEREIEIGYPTDVKHVAHIGWDGPSGSAPSWMNEFRTVPDFTTTSIGNSGSALSPWSSQDYGESARQQSGSETLKDIPPAELPAIKKKQRRKKSKSTSSPKSNSSRASRAAKSKSRLVGEGSTNPAKIEVV
ncbi:hypothetical protein F511_15078 [Dorcoceras hygrometricum]|uniref:CRIB domain-containing protein n=1 Tax=Dorcoceras hygrometricum TaxID=472368 RepID=A0A2Z7BU24_9LAMI|nr:hypothetical protein F511_15078 [Dorcoceras hygrometricum]